MMPLPLLSQQNRKKKQLRNSSGNRVLSFVGSTLQKVPGGRQARHVSAALKIKTRGLYER